MPTFAPKPRGWRRCISISRRIGWALSLRTRAAVLAEWIAPELRQETPDEQRIRTNREEDDR